MGYCLDLSLLSIEDYKNLLQHQNLLPGRRILLEQIDARFAAIAKQGVSNLALLAKRLSSAQKCADFAAATGISQEYLTILKRELGSMEQKPVLLSAFPGLEAQTVSALAKRGILHSKDYFERGEKDSPELISLCDLVRINGVGAVAAKAFYEAGYRSVSDVAAAASASMLQRVTAVNDAKGYYKAKLGEKDMQFCIDFAKLLMQYSD